MNISMEYTTSKGYILNTKINLKGRGIELLEDGMYSVTEKAMDKIKATYKGRIVCNF